MSEKQPKQKNIVWTFSSLSPKERYYELKTRIPECNNSLEKYRERINVLSKQKNETNDSEEIKKINIKLAKLYEAIEVKEKEINLYELELKSIKENNRATPDPFIAFDSDVREAFEDRKTLKPDQHGKVAHVEARTGPETEAVNTWNDIVIEIIDNETLSIKTGENKASRVNCSEIGFMNKTTSLPNLQWRMLESLAKYKGLIPYREWNFRERKQIEKQISELRKILKSHFKIDSDPIPFKKKIGYETVFILRDKRPGAGIQ
ncbi:MAG: hypothetical protein HQ536_01530 [Parcubacteria group bacterium]|nr:hypothetical protein [Parcubacteria group bacterium]